ncbi:hypothetical protein D3C80_2019640 [compost metagenome]
MVVEPIVVVVVVVAEPEVVVVATIEVGFVAVDSAKVVAAEWGLYLQFQHVHHLW